MTSAENLTKVIIECIQDKKGEQIVELDLQELNNTVCDYFIICHADSGVQIQTIADHITRKVRKELKENVWNVEGYTNAQWILLDYSDVVVHIFDEKYRKFLDLEGLWADAKIKEII
jgi:ribosome-associated protein